MLTGFMGTGKTTVGRIVAQRLGFDFVDTDGLIEAEHGPIPLIFADEGEEAFRRYEHQIAVELAARRDTVIATGGRLMLDPDNAEVLGATATVVALTAPVEEILRRVLADDGAVRPLLVGDDPAARIRSLLAERAPLYARFTTIDTADRTPEQIADRLLTLLKDASFERPAS